MTENLIRSTMEAIRFGIIGGSGLYKMEGLSDTREIMLDTPFGKPSDAIVTGLLDGVPVAFLARHGHGHIGVSATRHHRGSADALTSAGTFAFLF